MFGDLQNNKNSTTKYCNFLRVQSVAIDRFLLKSIRTRCFQQSGKTQFLNIFISLDYISFRSLGNSKLPGS